MAEKTKEPADLKQTDTSVIGGGNNKKRRLRLLRRPMNIVLAIVLVAFLAACGWAVYHYQKLADDTKVAKSYNQYMASNTDCGQYLKQFGGVSGYRPATEADLLQTDITCAVSTQQYSKATTYVDKLQKTYAANPSLYHYVNIKSAHQQISQLQAQPQASSTSSTSTASTPIGRQADGSYDGP